MASLWNRAKNAVKKVSKRLKKGKERILKKMNQIKGAKYKKIRLTSFKNGLPYNVYFNLACPIQGNLSCLVKPDKTISIRPLRYSKDATLSVQLQGYLDENWSFKGNLRSLIEPKDIQETLSCILATINDHGNNQKIELFLHKNVRVDHVEMTLFSFLNVININTNLNVVCEQVMIETETEIHRKNHQIAQRPVFIRSDFSDLNFIVKKVTLPDQSTNNTGAAQLNSIEEVQFSVTTQSNGLGKLITISVPIVDNPSEEPIMQPKLSEIDPSNIKIKPIRIKTKAPQPPVDILPMI